MRRARAAAVLLAAGTLAGLGLLPAPVALAALAGPGGTDDCKVTPGSPASAAIPWAQTRLGYDRVRPFATGAGVTVAVVDSGVNLDHPQTRPIHVVDPTDVLPSPYRHDDVRDCGGTGHGTAVTAIIAAPPQAGIGFAGLAPGATIMPIKEYDPDSAKLSTADTVAAGIRAAVDAHARVVNLSLTANADTPALRSAVDAALAADVVVVTAAGNSGEQGNQPGYPAEYGQKYPNVLAVSAIDSKDQVGSFTTSGAFVGVAAPGVDILAPTPVSGYTADQNDGTSFAAPFVSATAALVRQRFPKLTAAEVVNRIKATADRPGVSVPDPGYGYGIVNPYLAVTAVRDDSQLLPAPRSQPPLPAPHLPAPPDRHLHHVAYAVGGALFGAAALVAVGAVVLRRTARRVGVRAQV